MDSKTPIERLLVESEAFNSLSAERAILQHGNQYGWQCSQGFFYEDVLTGKAREVDVVMTRSWEKKATKKLYGRLTLVVEVKSIRDYHLLFSPHVHRNWILVSDAWLGHLVQNRDESLSRLLVDRGLSASRIEEFYKLANKECFYRGSYRISGLRVAAPRAKHTSSAFRETNPAKAKDLDNSVLWRSIQSVQSAITAMYERGKRGMLQDIALDLPYHTTPNSKGLVSPFSIERYARDWMGYHPIVVIDSPLWMMKDNGIASIPWCRFLLNGIGNFAPWVDIVHSGEFPNYLNHITNSYQEQYRRSRVKPLRVRVNG